MAAKRIHMKTERAPEEQARLQEVRRRFQEKKPSIDDLVESGEFNEPVPHGEYLAVRQAAAALRKAREEAGLSLAEAAKRSGIDKGALSRLENGQQLNPTFHTLSRYAHALGMRWVWTLEEESKPASGHPARALRLEDLEQALAILYDLIKPLVEKEKKAKKGRRKTG
jgi:transcriptional regulator with XRE-family HTH domain